MNFTLHYETFSILLVAFLLGAIIGYERQYRQRTAGLRTNTLVATSAAIFVHLAMSIDTPSGAVRVISYVVSGVGFLGAGTIMKEGLNIRGLNTAATLWGSAAVGACAGAGMIADACMATFLSWHPIPCCAQWSTLSTASRSPTSVVTPLTRFALSH